MLRLSLDLPPSVNRLYRYGKYGVYMTNEGRQYKQASAMLARLQGAEVLSGLLSVTIHVFGGRTDLDNILKLGLDSLNGTAWQDDRQIVELHLFKHRLEKGDIPHIDLEIMNIENDKPIT